MNDSQQNKDSHHLLRSLVLIFLETILTFVLKHDRAARSHAKTFTKQRYIILFNTFLPSEVFYVTFDPKGLLFDHQAPADGATPNLVISASSIDLVRVLLTGNEGSLHRIRLMGDDHLHEEFKLFLRSISLPMVFADWKNWLSSRENGHLPKASIEPLMQRIEQQRSEINKLTIQVKEYSYDLKTLERKHKLMSRLYWVIIFALSISIAVLLWYNP